MGPLLGAWLANKTGQIIIVGLVLLGLVCGPLALWQAFEINGLHVFGWTIVHGYKDSEKLYADEQKRYDQLKQSYNSMSAAAKTCSDQTALWESRATQAGVKFDQTSAQLAQSRAQVEKLVGEIAAMPVSGDKCQWSLDLMRSKLGAKPWGP